jgi:hypothetical protein
MMKSLRNKLKKKAQEPRKLDEIQKDYFDLRSRAGEVQYQIHVLSENLKEINKALVAVNNEAAARQNLDKQSASEAAAQQPKQEETKEAQNG